VSRRVPPLNPLRVFETVARTLNLTTAAQQLHVSQSAVSRQIATLETYLGVDLFRRERHGVTLTQAGAAYAAEIAPAFEAISLATERLQGRSAPAILQLRTYTTFTSQWLIPRLPDFQQRHPDIEIVITNAVRDVDFDRDAVDAAIQFGDGQWPRVQTDLLFHDEIEPVCSPSYLRAIGGRNSDPERLLAGRLLVAHYRSADWATWLAATGRADLSLRAERMRFSNSLLAWQAAQKGLGTAIGQISMLESELEAGLLVRPFSQPVRGSKAFFLVRPVLQRRAKKVEAFRDWLLSAIENSRVDPPLTPQSPARPRRAPPGLRAGSSAG
jgi:LysR family glycine cleavage system transcriptional activator